MTLKEAEKIIEDYEKYNDKCCTCFQNAPCSRCVDCPPEDIYKEAQKLIKLGEEKAIKALEELLEYELSNYSIKWKINQEEIELYDGEYFIEVDYYVYDVKNTNTLNFKVREEEIFAERCEDIYEKIQVHKSSIKYLWMLIKWD